MNSLLDQLLQVLLEGLVEILLILAHPPRAQPAVLALRRQTAAVDQLPRVGKGLHRDLVASSPDRKGVLVGSDLQVLALLLGRFCQREYLGGGEALELLVRQLGVAHEHGEQLYHSYFYNSGRG